MLSDTDPVAAEVQYEILRRMTSSQRSSLLGSLTTAAVNHAKRAISRANAGAEQSELDLIFIRSHYGEELALEVKEYLENLKKCTNPC